MPLFDEAGVRLLVKREDLNHPFVSGNKWWKLRYNLAAAAAQRIQTLLTFGGAYSNHIYATAAAARSCGLESIGVIRGEETLPLNSTLAFARQCGMTLHYMSRTDYRLKHEAASVAALHDRFGDFYCIPEGGSNAPAVKGVKEFAVSLLATPFDYLCAPAGTGGTVAGLIAGLEGKRQVLAFPVLKGGAFLATEITRLLADADVPVPANWQLETDYHFGGYAKATSELLRFLQTFENTHGFRLDPIYTGKMMAGIFDLIGKGTFPRGSTLMAVHTGGLQGWSQKFEV